MSQRDYRGQVESLRERAQTSAEIDAADGELLIEFSNQMDLLQSTYGDKRHKKHLGNCVRLAENVSGLADALESQSAAEDLVRYINRQYENQESNRDYRISLRMFGEHVTDGDGKPDSIEWIPSTYSKDYNPAPDPSNMLRWEEQVIPMIEATRNPRDAAMIAVAWNLGARPFEFQDIKIGSITDSPHGMQITVDGKRGQRSPTLILAVPHLQRWLDDHPDRNDTSAPLWSKLTSAESVSDRMVRKIFETAAERAEVTQPVTLSNFRKSCASFLARQNVNQAHIEKHMGWTQGSDVASRYVAVFGKETEREVARAYGADVEEEEPDPIAPVTCPRCSKECPRHLDQCMWCGQILEQGAFESVQASERQVRQAALRLVQEDPQAADRIKQSEQLMMILEERPELEEEIFELAEDLQAEGED